MTVFLANLPALNLSAIRVRPVGQAVGRPTGRTDNLSVGQGVVRPKRSVGLAVAHYDSCPDQPTSWLTDRLANLPVYVYQPKILEKRLVNLVQSLVRHFQW